MKFMSFATLEKQRKKSISYALFTEDSLVATLLCALTSLVNKLLVMVSLWSESGLLVGSFGNQCLKWHTIYLHSIQFLITCLYCKISHAFWNVFHYLWELTESKTICQMEFAFTCNPLCYIPLMIIRKTG